MNHKAHPQTPPQPGAEPADITLPGVNSDAGPIVERPDGFYWVAPDGQSEFGPFESYELAQADRDAVSDEALESSEDLRQAEQDIGINEWIDAETGEPAEGQSPPHLEEE